ncbi:unnamed protein product [Mycena citricolor]|uniref:Mid2 domain-containing protein n=1 Tax=Mycena citricolor TaxID=2018698 RepID=A0AAD2K1V0_9AGAR|nr:unnamed protein product [Mycena citricolor]
MDRWVLLALSLFFATRGICAGHLDVLPQETIVPQCSTLEVLWDQPVRNHLHVQPNLLINVTNLFDLGIQNGTFTTYQVALPVGQNFSFAYNTLANQFLVFQSSMMTVGAGTAECLSNGNPSSSASSSSSSSSTSSSSTLTSSATAPVSTSLTAVLSPSAVPDTNSHSGSGISSGAVGGIVVGAVAVILAALGGFCLSKRRYKQKLASLEGSQHDSVTPRFLDQESGRGQAVTMISRACYHPQRTNCCLMLSPSLPNRIGYQSVRSIHHAQHGSEPICHGIAHITRAFAGLTAYDKKRKLDYISNSAPCCTANTAYGWWGARRAGRTSSCVPKLR